MLAKFSVLLAVLSVNLASAALLPRGTFITAPCNTDADCNSGCCAFNTGKCAGAIIALSRDGGCGRGEAASNSIAAGILRGNCPGTQAKRAPLSPDPAGAKNVGNGAGGQFITGQCLSNADCGSGCCATLGNIGICSGPGAADQQGKTGCGFGGGAGGAAPPPPPPPPAAPQQNAGGSGLKPDPNGEKNVGNGKGGQFITGQCLNNADCASGCCATLGNIGICSGPGAATQQGKTGCGFSSGGAAPPANPPPAAPQQNGAAGGAAAGGRLTAGPTPIGATCGKDSDCTTGCCATATGICTLAKQAGPNGCGKGAAPNNLALDIINGNAPVC